jgi:hypothetical protein
MSGRFLLTCSCGLKHPVSLRQAGESIECPCGKRLDLPTLREIGKLPQAEEPSTSESAAPWTPLQGALFVAGAVAALVALAVAAYFGYRLAQLELHKPAPVSDLPDARQLSFEGTWDLWTVAFRDRQLRGRQLPEYLGNRRIAAQWKWIILVAAAFAVGGATCAAVAVWARPSENLQKA